MSDEREFREKWQRRIDGCGPYCSCLVIIIVLVFAFFAFVLRWHPRTWPSGARPFKKLKIKDCTDRPYFGLHPDIVALILDLTGRVKGLLEHDGLFHPETSFELDQLIRQADRVTPFRP